MIVAKWAVAMATAMTIGQAGGQELQNEILKPAEQWPAGELNCVSGYRDFDPLTQKQVYTVGVHAPAGTQQAWKAYNLTFEEYLDRTVGDRWDPPIRFRMKPTDDPLRDWVDHEENIGKK